MIDEMMTLFESEQVGEVNKKAYNVKSFDERDDEAKAPTRQITGHEDLLFSSVLDESVTNVVEMQQGDQPSIASVRQKGVSPGDEVGASRPCEAKCEQADDLGEATIRFLSLVRGGVHCWRRRRNVGSFESQDIMTKYNEVNCVDKLTSYRDGGAREPDWSGCTGLAQW